MQYLRILFVLCLVFITQYAFAQKKELKTKFGKISDAEIAMKSYTLDPAAPAVVLFEKGDLQNRFDNAKGEFVEEYDVHVRIKIFNKSAYSLADVRIFHANSSKISGLQAVSYNLENDKLMETKLEKGNVFEEKITKSRNLTKFTIPNVKEGSIIEFKYSIASDDGYLHDWTFQRLNIPTIWSEYKAEIPSYVDYSKNAIGAVPFTLAEEENIVQSTQMTWTERSEGRVTTTTPHSEKVLYNCKNLHYIQENIPALKPEPYMAAPKDYLSQINFDIKAVYKSRMVPEADGYHIINAGFKTFNNSWAGFGKEMLEDVYDDVLKDTRNTTDLAKTAVDGKTAVMEKISAVYAYLGVNFSKTAYDYIWLTSTIGDLVKFKKGSATELNLLYINLLNKNGLNAWPLMISTRTNGRVHPFRVSPDELDRVITAIEMEDKSILLVDAAAYPNPIGLLDAEDINYEGLLLKSSESIDWIPIQNKISTRSFVIADVQIKSDGGINSAITSTESGYEAVKTRQFIRTNGQKEVLNNNFKDWATQGVFSDVQIEQADAWNEPNLKIGFKLESPEYATISGNKIYLNPALGLGLHENPFKNPERAFNIDLGIPHDETYSISWHIPAGYKVEALPKSNKLALLENAISFEYLVESGPELVKISIRKKMRKPYILKDEYVHLRQFYSDMVAKMEEQIVLTKL
jgi:hypothetical protein